jgi:hypothetical protein
MSEYQYYEFQAIDRPLDRAAQDALRAISSRARITSTSFTNHYDFGDFKGDPRKLMGRWFDLHLYLANWGSRRLMMRAPQRLLSLADLEPFLRAVDWVDTWTSGDCVIVNMDRDEVGPDDEWDDGSGWLAALAPLRADALSGDLRLFYLLWLAAVEQDEVPDDELEPLPGVGPLTGALEAFAEFFRIDPDLVQAAAERSASAAAPSDANLREALGAIAEDEKTELLLRVDEGDGHVAAELKRRINAQSSTPPAPRRTAAALRERAHEIGEARERAEAERKEAERRRLAEEAEKARRVWLDWLKRRGDRVWREIKTEIESRNAQAYDAAASLLSDLHALATEQGTEADFNRRLASIHARHGTKWKFIERLNRLGLSRGERTF